MHDMNTTLPLSQICNSQQLFDSSFLMLPQKYNSAKTVFFLFFFFKSASAVNINQRFTE